MAKLTLTDITTGYYSVTTLNANNALIETALENTLSRDGTTPNSMAANLDMDSNRILNLPAPISDAEPLRYSDYVNGSTAGTTTTATLVTVEDLGGYFTSTNVEGALQEAEADLAAHLADAAAAHAASAISVLDTATNFTGTDVETVLAEIISTYAAQTTGNGASKIGIEDSAGYLTATDVEAALAELANFRARGCLVYLSVTGQSISTGAWEAISFDGESYDTDTIHDLVTFPTRLTVPTGFTKVRLLGQGVYGASATGMRGIALYKNNSTAFAGQLYSQVASSASFGTWLSFTSPILTVVAGDYFELKTYQDTGAPVSIAGANDGSTTWFAMELIK